MAHQTSHKGLRQIRKPPKGTPNARPEAWTNPTPSAVYDLVVIGGGPAGLSAAFRATRMGKRVALIERHILGGVSVNAGTVSSKALLRTARWYGDLHDAEVLGATPVRDVKPDFAAAMVRMRGIQARLGDQISATRLNQAGIDVFFGVARFSARDCVNVSDQALRFRKALIATGAGPMPPAIPGLDRHGYFTSDTIFDITENPGRLLIVGGGPLGCELAQAFQQLGARVLIAQNEPKFLPFDERDAANILSDALAQSGVEIHLNTTVAAVRAGSDGREVDLVSDENRNTVSVDNILVSVGRQPNVCDLDLKLAGVDFHERDGIRVNDFLQTTNPDIYAAGDVCMKFNFANAAEAYAALALRNMFAGADERSEALTIPWCTYTNPEIAHVGLHVWEAYAKSIPMSTVTILMHDVYRAVTDTEETGFVKIHYQDGTDKILGATIVSRHASEMIGTICFAMTFQIGLRALSKLIVPYPSHGVAIKMAADAFNRSDHR